MRNAELIMHVLQRLKHLVHDRLDLPLLKIEIACYVI
jgi:hypothetical protein